MVPASLVQAVIEAMHSCSHPGVDKLTQLCRRKYIFPAALEERAKELLQGCSTCQTCKAHSTPSPDTQQFWSISEFPFASLAIDFVKLDECQIDRELYDTVFVIVDRLTGYVLGIPCGDEGLTAEKAAALFLDRCVHFVGLPHEIMSDIDKIISKTFFEALCGMSGIEQHKGVVKRPQSNGRAGAAVKSIVNGLRRLVDQRSGQWVRTLPLALWGLNDLPGVVSAHPLHRLVFGREGVRALRYSAAWWVVRRQLPGICRVPLVVVSRPIVPRTIPLLRMPEGEAPHPRPANPC